MDELDKIVKDGGFEYCFLCRCGGANFRRSEISLNLEAEGGMASQQILEVRRNVLIGGRVRR